MKIVNALFNFKKSFHENRVLGVERCFIDYSKFLKEKGAEVLSVSKPNMIYRDELKNNSSHFLEISARNSLDIFSMIKLLISLWNFKPDIVICHSGRALRIMLIARLFLFKKFLIIGVDHGINPKKFLKSDYVLTVNSHFSSELIKAGMSSDRALVIPNMIDVPKNFQNLSKKPFSKTIRLGSLGRIYSEKNFDKVIIALDILRSRGIEANYVIGGVGILENDIKKLAKDLNLEKNFQILGWVEEKRKFFEEIDIFILPSSYETFGIVLLEAMLYSTPIITTNSWGPDEIIADNIDGVKISIDEPEKIPSLIADAVENLIKNENKARAMAEKAQEKLYTKYTSTIVSQKLYEICKTVKK